MDAVSAFADQPLQLVDAGLAAVVELHGRSGTSQNSSHSPGRELGATFRAFEPWT